MSEIRVSDHAIVRYLERHYNFDVDFIRDEIFPPRIQGMVAAGARGYKLNGMEFVVSNGVIVTSKPAKKETGWKNGHADNKDKRLKNGNRRGKVLK